MGVLTKIAKAVLDDLEKDLTQLTPLDRKLLKLDSKTIDKQLPATFRLKKEDMPKVMKELGYKRTNHYYVKRLL